MRLGQEDIHTVRERGEAVVGLDCHQPRAGKKGLKGRQGVVKREQTKSSYLALLRTKECVVFQKYAIHFFCSDARHLRVHFPPPPPVGHASP